MAVTVTITDRDVFGSHQVRFANVLFDSSYPTGGEVLTAASLDLAEIKTVVPAGINTARYRPVFIVSTKALKLFIEDGTSGIEAEAANASDQSAITAQVMVIGK